MKLRYFKAKNIFSFGDEEVNLDFGDFNTIAGPNDSGKTNLFRGLDLIKKAFEHGKLHLETVCNNGKNEKCLCLEVSVELDKTELEILAKLIICGEIARLTQTHKDADDIWKIILKKYGHIILLKSLRILTYTLINDDIRSSEPRLTIRISSKPDLFIDGTSYITNSLQRTSAANMLSLGEQILNYFRTQFKGPTYNETISILDDDKTITDRAPTLSEILSESLGEIQVNCKRVIALEGGELSNYQNTIREEPLLRELVILFDSKGLDKERLYVWNVLRQFYNQTFVDIKELRSLRSTVNEQIKRHTESTLLGSVLAKDLFFLMSSGIYKNRMKFDSIKKSFYSLTGAHFEVAIREKHIVVGANPKFGVLSDSSSAYGKFLPLTVQNETTKQSVHEAFIQIIRGNYPVAIERSASGLYEILLLLTKVIGETRKVLLIDEPELHLHPSMQKKILNLLIKHGKEEENQILLITHSPYLVSAEGIENTWRFTATSNGNGTRVHNIGRTLSNFEESEKGKLKLKLSSDVRSLLFSNGVILVEGLSDRIVVEQVDRYLSAKDMGANIEENEWPILEMRSKFSLPAFIKLCHTLDIQTMAILDEDALMAKTSPIEKGKKTRASVVILALKNETRGSQEINSIIPEDSNSARYEKSLFEPLHKLAMRYHIFVLSSDLEGVLQIKEKKSPMHALEQIVELIKKDKIPNELIAMDNFIKNEINRSPIPSD